MKMLLVIVRRSSHRYLAANSLFGVSGDVSSLIVNFNIKPGRVSILYYDWVVFWHHTEGMWMT